MRRALLARRYAILVWGLLTIALAVVLSGCPIPTDDAAPFTIATSDGRARLTVPPGALPEGVTPDDITISEVNVDADFYTAQEVEPALAGFQLEPDGLQFSEPVTFTVELPVEDPTGRQALLFHVAGEDVEFITDVESEVDLETSTLTASIPLTHLSVVWTTFVTNLFEAKLSASASEVVIGQTFEVTAAVTRMREPGFQINAVKLESSHFSFYLGHSPLTGSPPGNDTWSLEGSLKATGPVAPSEVTDRPPLTIVSGAQQTFTLPAQAFECTSAGAANVTYDGTARYHVAPVYLAPGIASDRELEERTEAVAGLRASVQCVMPKITASAAPPLTTYTLSPEIPSATVFSWSGTNCGSVTGSTTNTMIWNHGEENCDHTNTGHPDATISLVVTGQFPISGESFELRCTYPGAASGEGPECTIVE